jgi:hypothetical protein
MVRTQGRGRLSFVDAPTRGGGAGTSDAHGHAGGTAAAHSRTRFVVAEFHTHEGLFEFLILLFSLTNASTTFQALMNNVLRPFLRRFVLVFFDDILIYSPNWTEHLQHVCMVLTKLQEQGLFVKRSKCTFSDKKVMYLGRHLRRG